MSTRHDKNALEQGLSEDRQTMVQFLEQAASDSDNGYAIRSIFIDTVNVCRAVVARIKLSRYACPPDTDDLGVLKYLIRPLTKQGPLNEMITPVIYGWMKAAEEKTYVDEAVRGINFSPLAYNYYKIRIIPCRWYFILFLCTIIVASNDEPTKQSNCDGEQSRIHNCLPSTIMKTLPTDSRNM
jgi:hypothetical protein